MKALRKIIGMVLLLAISANLTTAVYADILPVHKATYASNGVYALRENGDLCYGEALDTQNVEVIASDVKDYVSGDYGTLVILYKNGDVSFTQKNHYIEAPKEYRCALNAKELVTAKNDFSVTKNLYYIDNRNGLWHIAFSASYNNLEKSFNERTKVFDNVKKYDGWILSTDDVLYRYVKLSDNEYSYQEYMTNVKDFSTASAIILRNNGDLYKYSYYHPEETPVREAQNIESLDNVMVSGNAISYLDKYDTLYINNETIRNVRDFDTQEGHYVTHGNRLYNCYGKLLQEDAQEIMATYSHLYVFYKGIDGNLYLVKTSDPDSKQLYLPNIKSAVSLKHTMGWRGFFITNNGELWTSSGTSVSNPFLTSFCQKPTKIYINNKEIELTAKIQMVNDRTMYPFRECLENIGAKVLWDEKNKIAIGELNGITIEFPIGQSFYYINGVKHEMDTVSYIDGAIGRTYIPIRYVAEGLGFTVDWTTNSYEDIIKIY